MEIQGGIFVEDFVDVWGHEILGISEGKLVKGKFGNGFFDALYIGFGVGVIHHGSSLMKAPKCYDNSDNSYKFKD